MNPYLLLALQVFWLVSVGTAYMKGDEHARDAMLAQAGQAQEQRIRTFNQYTAEDIDAARAAAVRKANADAKAREIIHEFEMEVLHAKVFQEAPAQPGQPAPHVGPLLLSDNAMRLLNAAIDTYNANAIPADVGPGTLPPDEKPEGTPGRSGTRPTAAVNLRISSNLRADAR